jgi:hypothetical protein
LEGGSTLSGFEETPCEAAAWALARFFGARFFFGSVSLMPHPRRKFFKSASFEQRLLMDLSPVKP